MPTPCHRPTPRRRLRFDRHFATLALAAAVVVPPTDVATLRLEPLVVSVNAAGLIVGAPGSGVRSVDGPAVALADPAPGAEAAAVAGSPAEWMGVAFDTPTGHGSFGASGNAADWSRRTPMAPVSFSALGNRAVSVVQAGPLRITTSYSFDPLGPYLIGDVRLTNSGDVTLGNVMFTREWLVGGEAGATFPEFPQGMLEPAPPTIARRVWMLDDLPPGGSGGAGFAWRSALTPNAGAPPDETGDTPGDGALDVPLKLFVNDDFPTGLVINGTNGISFGDYDADGFTDIFACHSGELWRNVAGLTWVLAANLDSLMPPANRRYGSSFGDYDKSGFPDLGTEPRDNFGGDECLHLLRCDDPAGPTYTDIAIDPALVDLQPCGANSETICWADVDGDSHLDLFLPVYPASTAGGPGNFFLYNRGPTGPGGAYHFSELSAAAGLDNPPGTSRPEGACFADLDGDGDVELFSNATIYQNDSSPGVPHFLPMNTAGSGIGNSNVLDEGAMLFDYDLDGDMDLAIVYTPAGQGVRLWENRNDGTFFGAETSIVDSFQIGLDLGLSAEDWDGDGDIDFTTRSVFRRNQLMEQHARHFTVATHNLTAGFINSATPAWGDVDHDGDLDCALGNWLKKGHYYENTTYSPAQPLAERRFVRVRVMRDDPQLARGLETEYGALVDLSLVTAPGEPREAVLDNLPLYRRKFTSSAAGYINQNEYVLTFALPADPTPDDPATDLAFDLRVDFPHFGSLWRVDKFVNPLLGGIALADLAEREITVFRSGRVRLNGCESDPMPAVSPALETSASPAGLALPHPTAGLPAPTTAPSAQHYVGLAFRTAPGGPVRVKELRLDGRLAEPATCAGGLFNVLLWDVTDPAAPVLAPYGALGVPTAPRNRRTDVPVNIVLQPDHEYRLVAHVSELRGSPIAGPVVQGALTVLGGLSFDDTSPCDGAAVTAAAVDLGMVYAAVRLSPDLGTGIADLHAALAGAHGTPALTASGPLTAGSSLHVELTSAPPNEAVFFLLGMQRLCTPFKGGTLVPSPDLGLQPLPSGATGTLFIDAVWPEALPPGFTFAMQAWITDGSAPQGFAASNGLSLTTPF